MTVLLTRRAVVQAQMESLYNVAATLTTADGILCADPAYMAEPSILERNFTRDTLSPQAHIVGRLTAKMEFTTEMRGNGSQNSGLLANAPIITRLFRASGYQVIPNSSPGVLGPYEIDSHANPITWGATSGTKGTGTVTFATAPPANNDTVVVAGRTYTFKTTLTGVADEILIGATFTISAQNFKAAINHEAGEGTLYGVGTATNIYVVASGAAAAITLTALRIGTGGNVTLTKTATNITVSGATLTGGTNVITNTDFIAYYLTVVLGGVSGVATISVASDTVGETNAAAVVTSGTPFAMGTKGLTIVPTFTGSLVAGQRWVVWMTPPGMLVKPVSDYFESVTLGMYKDRVYHAMPGSYGTFDIDATAGEFATIKWSFTGTYSAPVDGNLPSPVYERQLPQMVELARLRTNSFNAIVNKFTFTQGNDIQIRPDVSSLQGYIGSRIVGRAPEGGIDPEADLVANYDFWSFLRSATRIPFSMRVGSNAGNTIWVLAPSTQYTKMTYTDRNGISTYDAGLKFSGYQSDDEMMMFFC